MIDRTWVVALLADALSKDFYELLFVIAFVLGILVGAILSDD